MSTEVINLQLTETAWPLAEEHPRTEVSPDPDFTVSHVPFEVAYQALYSPSPTPEEVRRAYFLLECD